MPSTRHGSKNARSSRGNKKTRSSTKADDKAALPPDVVQYLRDEYREHGHTPNFRNMLKGMAEIIPGCDSKALYDLFPLGPAKQGAKVAGLPQPLGKGGY